MEWNLLKDHKRYFLHQLTCDEHERSVIFSRQLCLTGGFRLQANPTSQLVNLLFNPITTSYIFDTRVFVSF